MKKAIFLSLFSLILQETIPQCSRHLIPSASAQNKVRQVEILRSAPVFRFQKSKATRVATVQAGERYNVVRVHRNKKWVALRVGKTTGWVSAQHLQFLDKDIDAQIEKITEADLDSDLVNKASSKDTNTLNKDRSYPLEVQIMYDQSYGLGYGLQGALPLGIGAGHHVDFALSSTFYAHNVASPIDLILLARFVFDLDLVLITPELFAGYVYVSKASAESSVRYGTGLHLGLPLSSFLLTVGSRFHFRGGFSYTFVGGIGYSF